MKCPICNTELGNYYSSPSFFLRNHVLQSHIGDVDYSARNTAIRCLCGRLYRGLTSFTKHLLALNSDDKLEHAALDALGAKAVVTELLRGSEHYGHK